MKIINEDILRAKENIIVQQVNHRGVMGAGLARQIRNKYPGIFKGYSVICSTLSFEEIKDSGYVYYYVVSPTQTIASVFGQDSFGRDRCYTDYVSLRNGLKSVYNLSKRQNLSVAIPFGIGCGLAGGNWNTVKGIIIDVFGHDGAVIYKLRK